MIRLFRKLTTFLIFVSFLSSWAIADESNDIYVLEKSIDVLTVAKNFRSDKVVPASKDGNLTVIRRVQSEDPRWWPQGVAIQVLSVNGREERPVKIVYVAKKWFNRGASEGDVARLANPQDIQNQVLSSLTPVVPECQVEVTEAVIPQLPNEPDRPSNRDTYSTLAGLVTRTNSQRTCANALRNWYRENSMWKDLSRKDRAKIIVNKAHVISNKIRLDGLVSSCARASGKDERQVRAFMEQNLSTEQVSLINYSNFESNCRDFLNQNGGGNLDQTYFRKRVSDPSSIHPQFDASLAVCIIKRETSSTNFDPHSMNYSFCQVRGRQGRPRSTAHGLGQFTRTTFLSLRDSGQLPLTSVPATANRSQNTTIFKEMSTDPDMQVESIFYYINYLLKAPSSARIRHMHDQVYNDRMEDWEKAVISYDQDRASAYIQGVHSCRRCYQSAGNDTEAQAKCLTE